MPLEIPGAPDYGGALAEYLTDYQGEIGWIPPTVDPELLFDSLSDLDRNDPATWVAFAGASLQTIWAALPQDVRTEVRAALQVVIDQAIQGIGEISANAAAAAARDISGALPFIGAIIEALVALIKGIADVRKNFESQRELTSAQWEWAARYKTVQQDDPNRMVFISTLVQNYLHYDSPKWYLRPCFARSGGASDSMMVPGAGLPDKGSCSKGVRMDCPGGTTGGFFDEDECEFHDDNAKVCERDLGLSSLFYPFWSPAYPDRSTIGYQEGMLSPDQLMVEQQFALLSSPAINLQVNADRLLEIRDRFVKFFFGQVKAYAPPGAKFGLLKITNGKAPGTPVGSRLIIAPEEEKNYAEYQDRLDKFYLDENGMIQVYKGANASLDEWGVRAVRGPQTPKFAAISAAQYNAVVGSTLAFMSARAHFLRRGSSMKALLHDFGAQAFDPNVWDAMEYAAAVGTTLPMPEAAPPGRLTGPHEKPKRAPKKPDRLPKFIDDVPPKRLGKGGGGGGGGAGLVVAAAAAAFILSRR